jgi:hypothetical protein
MAIAYKDGRGGRPKRSGSGPLLVAVIAAAGLLWLSPQVTDKLGGVVSSVLRLPIY